MGSPHEPSEAGRVGEGGARERAQFSRKAAGLPRKRSLADFAPTWSECGDSNPGPPAPKAGALPTAQHPDRKDCAAARRAETGTFLLYRFFCGCQIQSAVTF